MKHHRIMSISAVAAVAVVALAGCSGSGSSGDGSAGGTSGDIKIGIALPAGNQTFWTGWINGAQAKADELGVELTLTDAKGDANTMNDQINTMIVGGVQAIAMATVDPVANKAAVQAATDAGLPLITSNRSVDMAYGGIDGANPILHTGFNDVALGAEQAKLVIQACEGIDPCNVLLEVGTLGSTPQLQRSQGLEEGLEGADNVTIVDQQSNDFDPTKAVDVTQSLLQAHPDTDLIVAQGDPEAVAAVTVLKEQGLEGSVKVIGLGGSKDGTQAVADGTLFGTPQVSSKLDGATSVETLVELVKKESIDLDDSTDIPTVVVPSVLITKDNAADHPGDW